MKKDYCDITFIIDRSGSMGMLRDDVIGSFNTFIDDQKKVKGEATFSLIQFDDYYEPNYESVNIQDVNHLDRSSYSPRGMTAMFDALGKTITATGKRLSDMPEALRPEKVIMIIQTDGQENASFEYTSEIVKSLIKEQQDTYSWEFVFLGSNIDAVGAATNIGIKKGNSMTYASNVAGTQCAFRSVSENMTSYRCGSKVNMSYTGKDINAQVQAGV